jgi:ribosomal-protein-alanine N-acetyltransferase
VTAGRLCGSMGPMTRVGLVRPEDAFEVVAVLRRSRSHLADTFRGTWEERVDVDAERARIVRALSDHDAGRAWPGVIRDARTGELLGRVALHDIVLGNRRSCFVSYWLAAAAVGRGHATRAVAEILTVAFGDLRLHRVEAFVRPANATSLAVLARCNFERIGVARRHTFLSGDWRDELLLQKLAPWDSAGVLVPTDTEPAPDP